MVVTGVRSSWEASATNWRSRSSDRVALVEGVLDAAEHLVEGDAELAGLGAGAALGHPVRQVAAGDGAWPWPSSA